MKKLAVLGCTGSIGRQTLDIVRNNRNEFSVSALTCANNAKELAALCNEFDCKIAGIRDPEKAREVKSAVNHKCEVFTGDEAAIAAATCDADIVVVAIVGIAGLAPVLAALSKKKTVALANKESLVSGGELVMSALAKGGDLRPVDSEHCAVWQALQGEKQFKRIILTASGGPFYFKPGIDLSAVTPEQATAHPTWSMGKKISVDSATMMNKALEIIEARWLFDTKNIDYVIHPQSVVHSMVEFDDGSIKAQAADADMRLPILYALTYPQHKVRAYTPLNLPLELNFYAPDEERFPAPKLAREVLRTGGNAGVVFNAANEAAVALFLAGKLRFNEIVRIVEGTLERNVAEKTDSLQAVLDTHNRIVNQIYLQV